MLVLNDYSLHSCRNGTVRFHIHCVLLIFQCHFSLQNISLSLQALTFKLFASILYIIDQFMTSYILLPLNYLEAVSSRTLVRIHLQ